MPTVTRRTGDRKPRRDKLGLALSGGGFRASLFHLGVLRRLAELDILRYVETLSTVSGGSIIGALYILTLKKYLDRAPDGRLARQQYIDITKEVEERLTRAVQMNLRTRLFMNPFGVLRVLLTGHSLGKRMARLYERYLYREIVEELRPQSRLNRWFRPGRILMSDLRMAPGGRSLSEGIESYNERQVKTGGSAVTQLIVNATSLNSGARFWYSHTELGDWYLGHFRRSETRILLSRRKLLRDHALEVLEDRLRGKDATIRFEGDDIDYRRRTVSLAAWWRRGSHTAPAPEGWVKLFSVAGFPGRLAGAAFGALRQVKIPAWYIRVGSRRRTPVSGALEEGEHLVLFFAALRKIDEELHDELEPRVNEDVRFRNLLLDFVLELYWLRSAEVVSAGIRRDWERLTLGSAVGASACFPPVFPPFLEPGFFDDSYVRVLGLTDGGVYDNIGITALGDEHCNYIIASDTSGPMDWVRSPSSGRLATSGRIISILMGVIAGLQREGLQERRRVSTVFEGIGVPAADQEPPFLESIRRFITPRKLEGLAFFHIASPRLELPENAPAGLDLDVDGGSLSRIRTDLDAFGDVEIDALVNHGYDTADRYIRKYLLGKELFAQSRRYGSEPPRPPRPVAGDARRARRIIEAGRWRFFRALRLGAPLSWLFTLLVLGIAVGATRKVRLSPGGAASWLMKQTATGLDDALWWLPEGWTEWSVPLGLFIAALAGSLLVLVTFIGYERALQDGPRRREAASWRRGYASAAKWMHLYVGNLLWLVKGLPVIVALGTSLVAWMSHLFHGRPFVRRTRRG